MNKINIAILGGAFDPITVGHIQLAQHVLDSTLYKEVWLMPCHNHLYGKKMASSDARLEMCRIAAQDDLRLDVSDYEIQHQLSGKTFQLVEKLFEEVEVKYGHWEFSIIIGMDNAINFDRWYRHEQLKEMISFVVVPRKGCSLDIDAEDWWFLKYPHVYLGHTETSIDEVSSTEVRDGIRDGKDVSHMLDRDVLHYIECNGLYKNE